MQLEDHLELRTLPLSHLDSSIESSYLGLFDERSSFDVLETDESESGRVGGADGRLHLVVLVGEVEGLRVAEVGERELARGGG